MPSMHRKFTVWLLAMNGSIVVAVVVTGFPRAMQAVANVHFTLSNLLL